MRKPGKSDILYFFFLSLLIVAMLYGGISLIIDTFYNPPLFHITSSGITATGILFYFYYPPNGVFSTLIPLPFWVGVLAIVGIYSVLFLMLIRFNSKNMGENPLSSPVGFISGYGSIAFGFSILIIALVALIGFPIEAPGLTNLQAHPRFLYYQLIYAPIIEETEFRIIPLGLYLFLRYRFTGVKSSILETFLYPGNILRRTGRKLDRFDFIFILITSFLFGFAHYIYGGWSESKIPQAFMVGIFLAFGFMLFGPFVDIPMHFLFDGVATILYLPGDYSYGLLLEVVYILLLFACLIVTIILLILLYTKKRRQEPVQDSGIINPD